ncbi:MAG: hypothetical protein OEM46_04825 [Ignavibacteria bacterium]|nr:hypothetical protein [Ignavibacteria bacterium]
MFEKEIKFIGDFCFNQVRSLGSNFTLDKITAAGVHPAVVQYISAELDFMIYSDRRKLLQQSYFDYAGKEISDHFQKISGEIKKHKKISLDDSKKLIFQAVSFNINYLVRPRWSLIKLIFNDQPVISVEEMKMMLNYLYYYEYFKKVLNGYISKRNLVQISSTEFDILLNKIDNELINSNQHQVILNSFTSMGDFFNVGGVDKNRLPLSAVEIFCKEKNLVDLILKLRKAIPNEVKRRYDKVEIERILFSPDLIQKAEKEADIETETTTEQMIEALDADESSSEIEDTNQNIPDELNKSDIETFLSAEEEEALLSLYSEESSDDTKTEEETITTSESEIEITNEEFNDLEAEGVKTASVDILEQINSEPELTEENTELSDAADSEEIEVESFEISDENISENSVTSDEELDGIVDAIADDFEEDEIEIDEDVITDSADSLDAEVECQPEEVEPDLSESGNEKEIVQEMIEDFYGENKTDTSTQDDDFEPEGITETVADSTEEEVKEKIISLEDDLLNIFEDLDKEEFKFPEKERFSIETPEYSDPELQEEEKGEPLISTEATDGFDEYLKSIDEAIFTEKPTKLAEENKPVEVEAKIETPVEKVTEIKEQPKIPTNDKNEKAPNKTRTLRQKDLFKYLRRKEVKKIVSYIFANDEEDFTNTVERIMDCHSYKESSEILKAVFTSYKISPYSKEAITFTNAVSNYFRQA